MRINFQRKADLLGLNDVLVFPGFLFSFRHFKAILAVVHDLADGRFRIGRDLDKIEVAAFGDLQRLGAGHDAELLAVVSDETDLLVADRIVDLQFFDSDGQTPPK